MHWLIVFCGSSAKLLHASDDRNLSIVGKTIQARNRVLISPSVMHNAIIAEGPLSGPIVVGALQRSPLG